MIAQPSAQEDRRDIEQGRNEGDSPNHQQTHPGLCWYQSYLDRIRTTRQQATANKVSSLQKLNTIIRTKMDVPGPGVNE
jgi:hypothetical protein